MDVALALAGAALGQTSAPLLARMASWSSGVRLDRSPWAFGLIAAPVIGVLAAATGWTAALPAYVIFGLVAAVLLVVDLELHRLPNRLTLSAYPISMILFGAAVLGDPPMSALVRAMLGAAVALGVFVILYVIAGSGLGAGDVKYGGVVGLHLAWLGWPTLAYGLIAGFVLAGLVSLGLLITRRATLQTRLPFGPSMIIGAVLAVALT